MAKPSWPSKPESLQKVLEPSYAKGKRIFQQKCSACHTMNKNGVHHQNGPNLNMVIGREAGKVEGYNFSKSLQQVGCRWTRSNMNIYLKNPHKYVTPGIGLCFRGLRHAQERVDLVEYLERNSDPPL